VIDLWGIFGGKITRKRFESLTDVSPRRICFASTHRNALKGAASSGVTGYFNVPFDETIGKLFPWRLFQNKYGYSRTVKSDAEFRQISEWVDDNRSVVFIRSLLDTCVAASEHQGDDGRSDIGELEYRAKWQNDPEAADELGRILGDLFERLYRGMGVSAVCAVPSSTPGAESLPMRLAKQLAVRFDLKDVTGRLRWQTKKDTIKDKEAAAKWGLLEAVGLAVDGSLSKERVLIVDDMYQSGATVHFVASRLQEAGANAVHCLAVSKSRGDKDNL
jgi:hypothetical protein